MEYKAHLFICTANPENPGKCGGKGSEELRKRLKNRCSKEFGKNVRINSSGCLGHCEFGIAAVLYPQTKWFLQLNQNDDEKLYEAVKTARESAIGPAVDSEAGTDK